MGRTRFLFVVRGLVTENNGLGETLLLVKGFGGAYRLLLLVDFGFKLGSGASEKGHAFERGSDFVESLLGGYVVSDFQLHDAVESVYIRQY